NPSVTSSAKMNMIISGDDHKNIECANSLSNNSTTWSLDQPDYDLIITNPPIGTSESDLPSDDLAKYPISTTKGQLLFLQKMIKSIKPGGYICTVIDDGVLNNDNAAPVRKWLMDHVQIRAITSLPAVTFKPNKITVKSSVLLLRRFDEKFEDPDSEYSINFITLNSLRYHASGELNSN